MGYSPVIAIQNLSQLLIKYYLQNIWEEIQQ